MSKRKKRAGGRQRLQVITLCISTTLVLILLGMVAFFVQAAHNLSDYVKENLTVTVMLNEKVTDKQAEEMIKKLETYPYTSDIVYISREQAKKEQSEALGSDPSEFLGFNPFTASLEVKMRAEFANRDSLSWISEELKKDKRVSDVAYQEDLMDKVNSNLSKVNMVLLILAVLLTCVSFSLINNTIRLSIYSRRFMIHTMKLVGASWGFIRSPFVTQAVKIGLSASLLACMALGGGVYMLFRYEPGLSTVVTTQELLITAAVVVFFGLFITTVCAYFSVNKFLKMSAEELYKI